MAQQLINIGESVNDKRGDPLRTAFDKVNQNFTELFNTDVSTKYHLGDDVQFVDVDAESGMIVIQSGFDTGMPVYIKGANCSDEGVGGDVIIEAGGAPLPNNGTTGVVSIAAREVTIETEGGTTTFATGGGGAGYVTFPEVDGAQLGIQGNEILSQPGSNGLALTAYDGSILLATHSDSQPVQLWEFDRSGTINTPLLFPLSFTAVLDVAHRTVGTGTYTGPAWEFNLEWQVSPSGQIELMSDTGPLPSLVVGYADGQTFEFIEADHGIPNYILTVTLYNVVHAGPAGWTANLSFSEPPAYPSTINSAGAIKLTANENSWTFGTTGKLQLPPGGDIVDSNGDSVLGGGGGNPFDQELNSTDSPQFDNLDVNGNLSLLADHHISFGIYGKVESLDYNLKLSSINGITFVADSTDSSPTWGFGGDGVLTLPEATDNANIYRAGNIGIKTDGLSGGHQWTFDTDGNLTIPGEIKSTAGTGDVVIEANNGIARTWTFGGDGYINLPGGTSSIVSSANNIAIESNSYPGGSRLSLSNNTVQLVSEHAINLTTAGGATDWVFGTNGTLTLPPQAETLRNVGDISTAKIYRATNSTDPLVIREARNVWYGNETEFTFMVAQEESARGSNFPWHGMPSWEAYPLILSYSGGGLPPSTAMGTAAKAASDSYITYKELESNIDIVSGNKTFSFENTGSLSLPGELTFADTTKAKIFVGALEEITWTFGVDGSTTFPNGVIFDGSEGNKFALNSGTVSDIDLRDDHGRGFYTSFDGFYLRSNGDNTWKFGTDANLTMPQLAQLSVVGNTPTASTNAENNYNSVESEYMDELTAWMTVNSYTPVWYLLPSYRAYSRIVNGNYDQSPWIGTAALISSASAALNAYNDWQSTIANSKITVKSDAAAWTFDSTNKLTLPKGGVVAGGDPAAIAAADSARIADDQDWAYIITTGGADTNIRPWHFAGPSRAEKQAVLLSMWQAQQNAGPGETLGWAPISASFYNEVRSWLALESSFDGYELWKKLTTAVNITSEDNTWSFTNDGNITLPANPTITVPQDDSLNFNLSFQYGPGTVNTTTFSISPTSITLPTGNGSIIVGTGTWNLDTANTEFTFPNTDKILYNHNGAGLEVFTYTDPVKITSGQNKSWTFGTDGNLTFPDTTVQSTAFYDTPAHLFFVHPNPGSRTYTKTGSYNSPFNTITAAIDAAVAAGHNDGDPATIILLASITENVVLKPGIYLTSLGTGTHGSPNITGTITITSSTGTVSSNHYSISNLRVIAPTNGHCLYFTGTAPQKLFVRDMWLDANGTGDCLYLDNTGSGSTVQFDVGHLAHSGTGDVYCINVVKGGCYVTDIETSGACQVAAVQTGAVMTIAGSELDANGDVVCETYGTGSLTITTSIINNTKANSNGIQINDAGGTVTLGNNVISVPVGTGYAVKGPLGGIVYHAGNIFTANSYRSTGLGAGFISLPTTWATKA